MIRSKLFFRLFLLMVVVVGLFATAIYTLLVPLAKSTAFEIELNASRTILDNVFEITSRIDDNLEEQKRSTLDRYKGQLKDVVSIATSYVDYVFGQMERGEITEAEARRLAFDGIRSFRFGNGDYVWATDYNSVLLSHPDPQFQGRDASYLRDGAGKSILPTIVDIARKQGDGYQTYPWRRMDTQQTAEKISYFRDLPKWGIVVGSGVQIEDIDAEVARRKAVAIAELREALRNIRIARTGYVYIFDAADNMIIHPNSNIEGHRFSELLNPATGHSISQELKDAADKGIPATYLWDKPSDPGNYAYQKISWVRHFKSFDWYIASSVYVDELHRSATLLGNQILAITAIVMLLATSLGYVVARRLVQPLNRLAETAAQVRAGDLNAESGIVRDDEIGVLSSAFDGMVRRLRDNIASLDSRVRERTAAAEETNVQLQDAIASQHLAQMALTEVEARQRLILDALPAAVAYLDRDEKLQFANREWAAMMGGDQRSIIGQSLAAVIGRRAYASITPHMTKARKNAEANFDYSFTRPDGRAVITKNSLIAHTAANGEAVGLFVLSLDVTEERENERHLLEAQRLRAVGQLSGGLAHDFNNLLTVIIGNLATAREKYAAVEGLEKYLEPAQRAGHRGADITSRLLSFSRLQPLQPAAIEVCALLRETAVLLHRSLPRSIEVVLPEGGPALWTYADSGQLENALVNLALNARDAMPGGGRLGISVGPWHSDGAAGFDEPAIPGDYVEIRVSDTGSGFTPDALTHAFDPFYTTKELGSGLGLSMVYGFVKQSKGYIQIDSQPGIGTCVSILLPIAEPPPPIEEAPANAAGDARWAGQLALLVEDNDDVRAVVCQQLVDLGFSVVEASGGDEAAALVEQIDEIALVISDMVMPGLGGLELAARVRHHRPQAKMVLISGFSEDQASGLDGVVLLRKPWKKQELINAIRQSAENRTGSREESE